MCAPTSPTRSCSRSRRATIRSSSCSSRASRTRRRASATRTCLITWRYRPRDTPASRRIRRSSSSARSDCKMQARGRVFSLLLLGALAGVSTDAPAQARGEWPYYGADAGGTRYSPLSQIDRDNVEDLERAWEYSTGELVRRGEAMITNSSTQTTPILVENTLLLCTPFNRLIALDPATGREHWAYDARVDGSHALPFQYNCRGVSAWRDPQAAPASVCAHRVFMGTNDSRLIAVDLSTGRPCAQFGTGGEVRVPIGAQPEFPGELKLTS